MNYLITASSGFVGSRFLSLAKKHHHNFKFLTRNNKKNINQFIYCDITKKIDPEIFDNIDIVIHIAGYAHENYVNKTTDDICLATNYSATINLAKIAVQKNVKKFIYLSSIKAAGAINGFNINEDMQGPLKTQYSKSKRQAEIELLQLSDKESINVVVIRSALIYGPNLKGNLKTMYNAIENRLMPKPPKTLSRRAMVHVDDVINCLMFVSTHNQANNQIFNLTDNEIYDLEKIYNIIKGSINNYYSNIIYFPKFIYLLLAMVGSFFNILFYFPYSIKNYNSMFEDSHFCSSKINNLGFYPTKSFQETLKLFRKN